MRQQTFVNNKATLYLVATPIGNLSEFTFRAIETLKGVALIGCEDTRTSKVLLDYYKIETPVISYHKFNEQESFNKFIELLEAGKDVALISDAGYPLVSDPGSVLVKETLKKGYNVSTISGPCAFLNALVSSGMNLSRFTFIGFLPSTSKERKKVLSELKENKETLIFYEAPHRINATLKDLLDVLGDRQVVLARELTKKFEEYLRGSLWEIIEEASNLKGEMVLIVEGNSLEKETISEEQLIKEIKELLKEKNSKKDIVQIICEKYDLKKNYVYKIVCDL